VVHSKARANGEQVIAGEAESMAAKRVNRAETVLSAFKAELDRRGLPYICGQGLNNRLVLKRGVYFEFGDLRVDTPKRHIVIEVESAGGITNLLKYWFCLEKKKITRPLVLLHLFGMSSANDYASHLILWRHFARVMTTRFRGRFSARLFRYPWDEPRQVTEPMAFFRRALGAKRL
jgi:hypothetical protein